MNPILTHCQRRQRSETHTALRHGSVDQPSLGTVAVPKNTGPVSSGRENTCKGHRQLIHSSCNIANH